MSITGISNYRDSLFQWQSQQLKNTGNNAASSSSSSLANQLFGNSTSMTDQVSSMVELTKYAMEQMGLSSDSRVTFSQITRYREQLESEFNEGVKNAIAKTGIIDITALSYELDRSGKITVTGGTAECRKAAQAWVDSNASVGYNMLKALPHDDFELKAPVKFSISATGKITVENDDQTALQELLNENVDFADNAREAFTEAGINAPYPLDLNFDDDGNLVVKGEDETTKAINSWLGEHTEIADAIKKDIEKMGIHESALSLRLGAEGPLQVTVNDAALKEIQTGMDSLTSYGSQIVQGLQNLGIDKNISFVLKVNDDGSVSVISDHPDAVKMQKLLDENPDLIKKYLQIETLAGIDDARKAMQISPSAMRKRVQIESMAAWWAGSSNTSSYFGNYNNDTLSILAGVNRSI